MWRWGKNDEWVFDHPSVKARNQSKVATFNQQIAAIDPYGVFSNSSTRRSGFNSPLEGGDFANFYYGACSLQDFDADGISNCMDNSVNDFSGMYTRIDDDGKSCHRPARYRPRRSAASAASTPDREVDRRRQ